MILKRSLIKLKSFVRSKVKRLIRKEEFYRLLSVALKKPISKNLIHTIKPSAIPRINGAVMRFRRYTKENVDGR